MIGKTANLFKRARFALVLAASVVMPLLPAHAVGVPGQGTWQTTLQGRDLDGNAANGFEAYYDTDLHITWLANANYAPASGNYPGQMTWDVAKQWVANLSVSGVTGWRLPNVVDTGSAGCDFAYAGTDCGFNVDPNTSELAHLFQLTLGSRSLYDTNGYVVDEPTDFLSNSGPFINVGRGRYWSGSEITSKPKSAWIFDTMLGAQATMLKIAPVPYGGRAMAWAVRDGDVAVSSVPEPQAYGLLLAGVLVVFASGSCRRRS